MRLIGCRRRGRKGRREHGSASVWVITSAAVLLLVAGAATLRAAAVVARHRAESAADLAALAGAGAIGVAGAQACPAAAANAARNGAALRSCRVSVAADGRSGTVDVRVALHIELPVVGGEDVVASARAGRLPSAAAAP